MKAQIEAPADLFVWGRLRDDVSEWCAAELADLYVGIYVISSVDPKARHRIEFDDENDAILFKLRWIGNS